MWKWNREVFTTYQDLIRVLCTKCFNNSNKIIRITLWNFNLFIYINTVCILFIICNWINCRWRCALPALNASRDLPWYSGFHAPIFSSGVVLCLRLSSFMHSPLVFYLLPTLYYSFASKRRYLKPSPLPLPEQSCTKLKRLSTDIGSPAKSKKKIISDTVLSSIHCIDLVYRESVL